MKYTSRLGSIQLGKCLVNKKAFTLIELLIVVAIIAILAAIAVPNFLEAQMRAKVSKAKAEQRMLANATEAYRVDNNFYMPYPLWGGHASFRYTNALTTPIAYISHADAVIDLFVDQEMVNVANARYGYFSDSKARNDPTWALKMRNMRGDGWSQTEELIYVFTSGGPDGEALKFDFGGLQFDELRIYVPYNPTNGTISTGDLLRFGPANPPYNE